MCNLSIRLVDGLGRILAIQVAGEHPPPSNGGSPGTDKRPGYALAHQETKAFSLSIKPKPMDQDGIYRMGSASCPLQQTASSSEYGMCGRGRHVGPHDNPALAAFASGVEPE